MWQQENHQSETVPLSPTDPALRLHGHLAELAKASPAEGHASNQHGYPEHLWCHRSERHGSGPEAQGIDLLREDETGSLANDSPLGGQSAQQLGASLWAAMAKLAQWRRAKQTSLEPCPRSFTD
jgi:hypothetical protein